MMTNITMHEWAVIVYLSIVGVEIRMITWNNITAYYWEWMKIIFNVTKLWGSDNYIDDMFHGTQ
jgi:hypothetical protein